VRALLEAPGVSARAGGEQVVALLDHFVEQGLMIRAGKRHLSLAILREHRHSDQGEP